MTMYKKTDADIIEAMKAEIMHTTEKIIKKYERKYGITIKRTLMPEILKKNRIEYPEQNLMQGR